MYVRTLTFMGRNPYFRRCRNAVVFLSGVKLATHCHFLFTAFLTGSSFALSPPNQGQILINTKYSIETIPQQYCDNVLPTLYLAIMSGVLCEYF